jgi:hypothetical protein
MPAALDSTFFSKATINGMADSNELPDVAGAGELDPRQPESGLEAPRKPRTEKQREAFAKCREALKKKKEAKAAPKQEPEPEPEPSEEAPVLATKPRGPRGPYKKQPKVYACPDCNEEFKDRFAKTNHRRRGHCPADQVSQGEEEQPPRFQPAFYFNIV